MILSAKTDEIFLRCGTPVKWDGPYPDDEMFGVQAWTMTIYKGDTYILWDANREGRLKETLLTFMYDELILKPKLKNYISKL